ncbi:NADPH:quinone reductase-like Zn-dependent oxidoreductase [Actinocorallia herbida]|uniref:NADPH:quinone reductase-like Zn-dependent oxidoreductase n=1 Tax=Actinocorallia herbida TaxID=58109 RepID=A0A3N1D3T0_9ACTN|nr:NADP-dependent oxidoreductase [Actinocorallia herbida]ROO88194.1 NADPH:quinone reductase-like Zn-dependent oxidoreductase [Actinocorallia herbida]
MMNAARFTRYGPPEVIRIERVPVPEPGPGEVLVEVAATSFNPTEAALRAGLLRAMLPLDLPYTPGWDVAGTVVRGAGRWSAGDRVLARVDAGGGAAGHAVAKAAELVAAPAAPPLAHAAAIPVAGLTAWQAVVEHAAVGEGEHVLINGAGGGIGGFAVQLAKSRGAFVTATASPRSAEAVLAQGADRVVDYTARALPGGFDVLINLVPAPPEEAAALPSLLRPGGRAVSAAAPIPGHPHFAARNDPAVLARLVSLIDAGALTVDIAETLPLTELPEVHARSERGAVRGKILIVP